MNYTYNRGVSRGLSRTSIIALAFGFALTLALSVFSFVGATRVPGHNQERFDKDNNGIPDAGVYVNGHYTSVYAYDDNGQWYQDLGDGRIQGTVGSVNDLDSETLTVCDYVINYRADFGNDPFMDTGWIQNLIQCRGFDDNNNYNYFIVHQDDPRYRGNPDWAVWGEWEYHGYTVSGQGNLVRPINHVGL